MRRLAPLIAAALLVTGCTNQDLYGRRPPPAINPSAVIAAELGFARLAQDKGQWTAFRETAADGAVMFVPQRVLAAKYLGGRANPPKSVTWQPHAVTMSCDGSAAVSTGAWQQPDGSHGYFTTIWRRQKDGNFKWLLDHGDAIAGPATPAPEFISAKLADCGLMLPPAGFRVEPGDDRQSGASDDGTLTWSSTVRPDGSRRVLVWKRAGDTMVVALDNIVAAPPPSAPAPATP